MIQLNEAMEPSEIMEELCVCYPVITRTNEFTEAFELFTSDKNHIDIMRWIEFANKWAKKAEEFIDKERRRIIHEERMAVVLAKKKTREQTKIKKMLNAEVENYTDNFGGFIL